MMDTHVEVVRGGVSCVWVRLGTARTAARSDLICHDRLRHVAAWYCKDRGMVDVLRRGTFWRIGVEQDKDGGKIRIGTA